MTIMNDNRLHVLLVEDIPVYVRLLQRMLTEFNIALEAANSLTSGIQKAQEAEFDAVLLDLGLPDSQGIDTFSRFISENPDLPIVILTGLDDESLGAKAVQLGAQDYLLKGPYLTQGEAGKTLLVRSIRHAIERKQIRFALKKERDLLEIRVAERTSELKQANIQLISELTERKRVENALRESEVKNKALISALPDLICRIDGQGLILDVKIPPTLESIFPLGQQFLGRYWGDVFPAQFLEKGKEVLNRAFKSGEPQIIDQDLSLNGGYFSFEYRVVVIEGKEALIIVRDITDRKLAEKKQRRYYERLNILREIDRATLMAQSSREVATIALKQFQQLVPYSQAGVLVIDDKSEEAVVIARLDEEGKVTRSGKAPLTTGTLRNMFNRNQDSPIDDPYDVEDLSPFERQMLESGVQSYFSVPLIAESNLIGTVILGARSETFTREHFEIAREMGRHLALVIHNTRLFEQLQAGRERLQYLTERLVSAQEDERRRISLELHDEAGQALTALKLSMALIYADLPKKDSALQDRMQEAISLTEGTMEQIRSLAHNLRPPGLEAVGLNQTLEDYCQRISRQTGMIIRFRGYPLPNIPNHYQISLYRLLQEALTNVIKHAGASEVEVFLTYKENEVCLIIQDKGVGFQIPENRSEFRQKGMGVLGMEERIEALGGVFEISSQLGEGTKVVARVPWRGDT